MCVLWACFVCCVCAACVLRVPYVCFVCSLRARCVCCALACALCVLCVCFVCALCAPCTCCVCAVCVLCVRLAWAACVLRVLFACALACAVCVLCVGVRVLLRVLCACAMCVLACALFYTFLSLPFSKTFFPHSVKLRWSGTLTARTTWDAGIEVSLFLSDPAALARQQSCRNCHHNLSAVALWGPAILKLNIYHDTNGPSSLQARAP